MCQENTLLLAFQKHLLINSGHHLRLQAAVDCIALAAAAAGAAENGCAGGGAAEHVGNEEH